MYKKYILCKCGQLNKDEYKDNKIICIKCKKSIAKKVGEKCQN